MPWAGAAARYCSALASRGAGLSRLLAGCAALRTRDAPRRSTADPHRGPCGRAARPTPAALCGCRLATCPRPQVRASRHHLLLRRAGQRDVLRSATAAAAGALAALTRRPLTAYHTDHTSVLATYSLLTTCCLLPTAYCLLPTAYCLPTLPTAYCLPPTAYCLPPTAYCLLPTAHCLLPTAYCQLPTAYCLLPTSAYTAYCLLPTSALYCLLPTAYRAVAALEDQGRGQRAGTHADQA